MDVAEALAQVARDLKDSPSAQRDKHLKAMVVAFPVIVEFTKRLGNVFRGAIYENANIELFWDNLNLRFRFNDAGGDFVAKPDGVYFRRPLMQGQEETRIEVENESLSSGMLKALVGLIKITTRP